MNTDTRCCGSGTCIIDKEGRCWCGQQWDGEKMRRAPLAQPERPAQEAAVEPPAPSSRSSL